MMKISKFGEKFTGDAGILSLMDDLGAAMASGNKDMIMMGGGNPGMIEPFQKMMRARLKEISEDSSLFRNLVGAYDPPEGKPAFLKAIADLLRKEYGWKIGPENVCLTNGSQTGFFQLFNYLAGECSDGVKRKIHLPLAPEYIGYADLGMSDDFFRSSKPKIEYIGDDFFKYHVDFESLEIAADTAALCVSRPTNPTGNVITDDEVDQLDKIARAHGIPLILDNAYGVPFPGIIHVDATPKWNENIVACFSLSKLGLPAVRTGIVIADTQIVRAISSMNAIMALSPTSFGAMLCQDLVSSGEILQVGQEIIRPFYKQKVEKAVACVRREFGSTPYKIHKPEGAMFLWLWFKDLPISSLELYQRLKARGVLVISGHYFFPGLEDEWQHRNECIRMTYSQDDAQVERGIAIIAEEVRKAFASV